MGASLPPVGTDSLTAALAALERRQEVVSHNLANADTVGFKAGRTFASLLADGARPTTELATDLRAGAITDTGAPLDLAVVGDGFFVVRTPRGDRLTRAGEFTRDAAGLLTDGRGNPVLVDTPDATHRSPLRIADDAASVIVGSDGSVTADGHFIGRLSMDAVRDTAGLRHEGEGLFRADGAVPLAADARHVRQGALEASNVSPIDALVEMISVQRLYGTTQKALGTIDATRGIAVSEIGKPL